MPKGFAACLNIVCRKIVCFKKLHFRGSCSTDSSILIKNTFDSIVLLLYRNLTKRKIVSIPFITQGCLKLTLI